MTDNMKFSGEYWHMVSGWKWRKVFDGIQNVSVMV